MRYDLVPIKGKYRGMARSLLATDLLNPKSRSKFELLLEEYFEFLEYSQDMDKQVFEHTVAFYKILKEYNIICEIIAYDDETLEDVFGYSIEFLGIDIVHDMCESLIESGLSQYTKKMINQNGLCRTEADVEEIIPYQDHGGVEWKPCYVYKVVLEEN